MAIDLTSFRCMLCGRTQSDVVFAECKDYYLAMPVRVSYVRCHDCGLVQQHPLPKDVSQFYKAYPIHQRKSRLMNVARRIMNAAPYYRPHRKNPIGCLVDYGCGDGNYLEMIADQPIERVGYEPDAQHAIRLSNRLGTEIFSDADLMLSKYQGRCDVVTAHFVFEHLVDPDAAYSMISRLLRPSGLLYLTLPEFDAWECRLFGAKWHGLDPPRHICFASASHVAQWAGRHGFEIESHAATPFPNGIAGSIPPVLLGRFHQAVFLAAMPLAIPLAWLAPQAFRCYRLRLRNAGKLEHGSGAD